MLLVQDAGSISACVRNAASQMMAMVATQQAALYLVSEPFAPEALFKTVRE
jgi:hypothetical protein